MNLSHPLDLVAHRIDGRILEVLCGADASFTGRRIHALLGSGSAAGVQLGLDRLHEQGLVVAEPAWRAILYRLNADHLAAPCIQSLVQLRRELLRRLRSEFERWVPAPAGAYLYGSSARRESTAASDIDILVVRPRDVDADAPAWLTQVGGPLADGYGMDGERGSIGRVLGGGGAVPRRSRRSPRDDPERGHRIGGRRRASVAGSARAMKLRVRHPGRANAWVSHYILAGIAAADVICCRALGQHAQGENHGQAVALLRTVRPDGPDLSVALDVLLGMKTRAGSGERPVTTEEQTRAPRRARQLVDAARQRH